MDALFLTIGGIFIPLGFYLKIEQPQLDNWGDCSRAFRASCLVAHILVCQKEGEKGAKRERSRGQSFVNCL